MVPHTYYLQYYDFLPRLMEGPANVEPQKSIKPDVHRMPGMPALGMFLRQHQGIKCIGSAKLPIYDFLPDFINRADDLQDKVKAA